MIQAVRPDHAQRGFFFEKHTQGGSILTGNKITETPYKFRATPINQKVILGTQAKVKKK